MLVLSRKCGESIVLPGLGVAVRVIRTNGSRVHLGIEAPDDVKILRGELCEAHSSIGSAGDANLHLETTAIK